MKQTGLILKINPKDYKVGASPLIIDEINKSGNWIDWKPSDERQFKDYAFDTMACATFSGLNVLENTINFFIDNKILSETQLEWLNANGYIENGKINCADRFNAIVSGTTDKGNTLQNVWDSFRNIGVIPEKDLPFGGNNWAEYMDKKLITPEMLAKAKKFLEIIKINYEWTLKEREELQKTLKQCPPQVVINFGTHAVELIEIDHIFDTYPPFLVPAPEINYALKGIVRVKKLILKKGMKGKEVKQLQSDLKDLGYKITIDGDFGKETLKIVKQFQKDNKLIIDGLAGEKTLAKIAELKKNPKK